MPRVHLRARGHDHPIDQIISLYTEALASAHLDEPAFLVLVAQCVNKLLRSPRGETHEGIVQMHVAFRLCLVTQRTERLLHLRLWIVLPRIDDVVDRVRMPEA